MWEDGLAGWLAILNVSLKLQVPLAFSLFNCNIKPNWSSGKGAFKCKQAS